MAKQHTYKLLIILVAALAAALIAAACGDGGASSPSPTTQAVVSDEATGANPFPDVVELDEPLKRPSEVPEELKAIWEAWAILTRDYVDPSKLKPEDFTDAAIVGMLQLLEDPGTYYVRPGDFDVTNQDLQGKFEGIGATVSMRVDGKLIIVSPIEGSPAEAAGLRPGDVVLEVDGEVIEGLTILEAVAKIRGPRGSKVRLLVKHLGALDPVEIVVTRDTIPLISVRLRSDLGDKIAHIRVTSFNADSADKLAETIQEAVDAGAEGLIIDVRDNPGGLLSSAIDVTSQFLEDGLVLFEVDGSGDRKNHKVRRGGVATEIPLVVLANEFSASASEILVGAIQDHERGTVIGNTTFGKGSVNILRRLSNDGGISVTISKFFSPSGRLIEGDGLKPDIEVVTFDHRDADTKQLEKAREVLEAKIGTTKTGRTSP